MSVIERAGAVPPVPHVPCGLCGVPTPMIGTRRCERCYELEKRVQADPEIARAVLAAMIENDYPTSHTPTVWQTGGDPAVLSTHRKLRIRIEAVEERWRVRVYGLLGRLVTQSPIGTHEEAEAYERIYKETGAWLRS